MEKILIEERSKIEEAVKVLKHFNHEGQVYFFKRYCKEYGLTKNETYWLYAVLFLNQRLYSI